MAFLIGAPTASHASISSPCLPCPVVTRCRRRFGPSEIDPAEQAAVLASSNSSVHVSTFSSPSPRHLRASVPGGDSRGAGTAQNPVRERAAQLPRLGGGSEAVFRVSKINTMTGIEVGRLRPPVAGRRQHLADLGQSVRRRRGLEPRPRRRHQGRGPARECIDNNGNGMIDTSTGPNDIKPWGQDECVVWHTAIPSPGYSGGARRPRGRAWRKIRSAARCRSRGFGRWKDARTWPTSRA